VGGHLLKPGAELFGRIPRIVCLQSIPRRLGLFPFEPGIRSPEAPGVVADDALDILWEAAGRFGINVEG
jgi:hypothetical protein